MNVVCTHCSHEFEMTEEAVTQTGGTTACPSCGEQTSLGSVPSGATLPRHPGAPGMPPGPAELAAAAAAAASETAPAPAPVPELPPEWPPARPETAVKPRERSVLFKLGEIQSMTARSAARRGDDPPEASGLLDIRMLAAKIHQHEEEEEAAQRVVFLGKAKASGPVALPTRAVAIAPAAESSGGGKGLIIAVVAFGVLIVLAAVLVYFVYAGTLSSSGDEEKQASATTSEMPRPATMDERAPDMRPAAPDMRPAAPDVRPAAPDMRPAAPDMRPAAPDVRSMEPPRPTKPLQKLGRADIQAGLANVADRVGACKKDRKGAFKLQLTVEGRTGKVKRVHISGRRDRKSRTGRCLKALFEKARFPPFKRRYQSFTHRVRVK